MEYGYACSGSVQFGLNNMVSPKALDGSDFGAFQAKSMACQARSAHLLYLGIVNVSMIYEIQLNG